MSPLPVRTMSVPTAGRRTSARPAPTVLGRYQNVHPNLQSRFAEHVRTWSRCSRCGLCSARRNVVLFRGTLPCDVLFIGEAPGESEDSIGVPFIGLAGDQLMSMWRHSCDAHYQELTRDNHYPLPSYAITNIVACIPRSPVAIGTGEIRTPHKEEAAACQPRLLEIVSMSSPKLIVLMGDIAKRFFRPLIKAKPPHTLPMGAKVIELTHPSRILRLQEENPNMASLLEKKFVIALSAALRELGNA